MQGPELDVLWLTVIAPTGPGLIHPPHSETVWYHVAPCRPVVQLLRRPFRFSCYFVHQRPLKGDDNDDRRATPMTKRSRHFGEFYVSPQTHLTYAATW